MLNVQWDDPNLRQMRLEARLGSTLRYFTRDIAFEEDKWADDATPELPPVANESLPAAGRFGPRGRPGATANVPVYGTPVSPERPAFMTRRSLRPDTTKTHPTIDDWHFCGYGSYRPYDPKKNIGAATGPDGRCGLE